MYLYTESSTVTICSQYVFRTHKGTKEKTRKVKPQYFSVLFINFKQLDLTVEHL